MASDDDLFALSTPGDRQFRLVIRTSNRVLARDIGALLNNLDKAFSRFVRENYGHRGARLRIVSTGTASWWVLLEQAVAIYGLGKDNPDLVAAFQSNVFHVIQVLRTHGPDDTPRYLRALVRDIVKAGRTAAASVIQIGATHVIEIPADEFDQLDATIEVYDCTPPKDFDQPHMQLSWTGAASPRLTDARTFREAGIAAASGKLFATLIKVENKWYARTQGMHGVLIPIEIPSFLSWSIVSGSPYQIDGNVVDGPEGYPISINARSVTKIGGSGRQTVSDFGA